MIKFHRANGRLLAYISHTGGEPGVFFLGGFNSSMDGVKAMAFEAYCLDKGWSYTRFDYSGHGRSAGEFTDGSIGDWLEDALAVFDHLVKRPGLIIGSSMGAWIGILLALRRSPLVSGLFGIASAPDFTERQIASQLTTQQRDELLRSGHINIPSCYDDDLPYTITAKLIEEGSHHLILGDPITLDCPVRLIHGCRDRDIPWQTAVELADRIDHDDVTLTLIKNGDHRLSSDEHLARIFRMLDPFVEDILGSAARR